MAVFESPAGCTTARPRMVLNCKLPFAKHLRQRWPETSWSDRAFPRAHLATFELQAPIWKPAFEQLKLFRVFGISSFRGSLLLICQLFTTSSKVARQV